MPRRTSPLRASMVTPFCRIAVAIVIGVSCSVYLSALAKISFQCPPHQLAIHVDGHFVAGDPIDLRLHLVLHTVERWAGSEGLRNTLAALAVTNRLRMIRLLKARSALGAALLVQRACIGVTGCHLHPLR
jgi:hypothetical protein